MPANNLLMRECEKSSNNVAARLAVIPLVQVVPNSYNIRNLLTSNGFSVKFFRFIEDYRSFKEFRFTGDTNLF